MNATSKNLDGYGTPPIEWEQVRNILTSEIMQVPDTGGPNRHTPWLTTINSHTMSFEPRNGLHR